jgi:hypothetical protein
MLPPGSGSSSVTNPNIIAAAQSGFAFGSIIKLSLGYKFLGYTNASMFEKCSRLQKTLLADAVCLSKKIS